MAAQPSFSLLADSMPQIVWMAPPNGVIDHWNRRFLEFTASPSSNWLELVPEAQREGVRQQWANGIAAREPFELRCSLWHDETRTHRTVLIHANPTRDLSDAVVGWVGTITDIDDHLKASEHRGPNGASADLDAARDEAKQARNELQQFAYAASHDMREPLRMVTSYLNLLERRYADKLDATANEYIRFAVDGAAQMTRLIDDLLAYSRVVGGDPPVLRPANMNGIAQWVLMNLASDVANSGALVEVQPDLPTISADENRLVIALQHIISNAIKFRSEAAPHIRIACEEGEGEWLFSVTDNGIGFDQQYAERIFGVFKRLHGKQYPGTGIGLAIARKVIERHGGRIWAESSPGHGARFQFTLPA